MGKINTGPIFFAAVSELHGVNRNALAIFFKFDGAAIHVAKISTSAPPGYPT